MSQHSDEHLAGASNSFWEVGNYKWTTKRIEDGHRLCDDFMKLVQERAEIEKGYAKALKEWSKKWQAHIVKGPEYGTTEAAWMGVLVEAEQRNELHMRVKENLINEVHSSVKAWQKDHYHKPMMGHLKEKKDIEDMFKKAQKQWAKYYDKCMKAKQDYHTACKAERTYQNQERNASGDSSLSPDQHQNMKVKRLQDRVSKAKEDVQKTKEKYEQTLSEISAYNPKYIEEMTHVFDRAQEGEQQRLEFFKKMLFATHKCLNISQDPSLPKLYEEFYHTISNADYEKDLKWWSNKYGVNMPMNWPAFEEYNPELHRIAKKGGKGHVGGMNDEVTLKSINRNKPTSPMSSKSDNNRNSAISDQQQQQGNPFEDDEDNSPNSNGVSGEDDEWDSERLVDPNKPGVPVKALYDYEGVEDDELSFKIGETFEKLEDQDEQGWCTGRKDGRIGLYPANYVEVI